MKVISPLLDKFLSIKLEFRIVTISKPLKSKSNYNEVNFAGTFYFLVKTD